MISEWQKISKASPFNFPEEKQESIEKIGTIEANEQRSEFNFNFATYSAARHQLNILCWNFADGP